MDLDALAVAIRDAHEAATVGALEHARRAGQLLNEAKEQTPHGQWGPWVKANLPFSQDTAEDYRKVAKYWSLIEEANSGRARISSIRAALDFIQRSVTYILQDNEEALGPGGHDGPAASWDGEDGGEDATTILVSFKLSLSESEEFLAFAKPHTTQRAAFLHAIRHRCER